MGNGGAFGALTAVGVVVVAVTVARSDVLGNVTSVSGSATFTALLSLTEVAR